MRLRNVLRSWRGLLFRRTLNRLWNLALWNLWNLWNRRLCRGSVRRFFEDGEDFAHFDVGALLMLDVREHTGAIGADFQIDFLGFELDERLAGVDRVALLLQPLRDTRFDDGFTKLGDNDVRRHIREMPR